MKKSQLIITILTISLMFSACGNTATATTAANIEGSKTVCIEITAAPLPTKIPIPDDGLKSDGKIHVYIVGEGEKVLTPDSAFIQYIIYYPDSKHMIINMNGKDYAFANINKSLWNNFKNASSTDTFYNGTIRDHEEYYINDYVPDQGTEFVVEYID